MGRPPEGSSRALQAVAAISFLILTRLQAAANGNSHPTFSRLLSFTFLQPSHHLRPPEEFLHPLPPPLARPVALMPRRPPIHRAAPPAHVLRHMRRHVPILQLFDKLPRVVAPIRPQRHPLPPSRYLSRHLHCRFPLRPPVGSGHPHVHDQTVPVLSQHVPQIAQLRLCRLALPPQPRLCVCRRLLRLIPSLLPPKVHPPIPPALRRLVVVPLLLLRPETLLARPRLPHRPVDRKMLARHQTPLLRLPHDLAEKLPCHISLQQPVPIHA